MFRPNPQQHKESNMSSTSSSLQAERTRAAETQRQANEERYLFEFLKSHSDVSPVEANVVVLRQFLDGVEINPGALQEAYDILSNQEPCKLAMRTSRAVAEAELHERKATVDAILDLTEAGPEWLENERKRLMRQNPNADYAHSLGELKTILEEKQLRQQFRAMTVDQLRSFVKRPESEPEVLPDKFSAAIIRAMAPGAIRQLLSRYGSDAVNARLQGLN